MDIVTKDGKSYLLLFFKNEEVIERLTKFAVERSLPSASFTAIGACKEVELAFYDLESKKYERKIFAGDREILGVTGNIAWLDDQPIVHAHGNFGDREYGVIGGHVSKLVISATCEAHLQALEGKAERVFDQTTGLNLLKS